MWSKASQKVLEHYLHLTQCMLLEFFLNGHHLKCCSPDSYNPCNLCWSKHCYILVKLDPIANQGLRLSLGAFRTSPSVSLHAEAQELPLHLRRQKLGMQYAVRISTNPQNPTYSTIFDGKLGTLFIKNQRAVPPFYIRVRPLLDKINFNNKNMDKYKQKIPPYKMRQPEILFDLSEYKKEGNLQSFLCLRWVK